MPEAARDYPRERMRERERERESDDSLAFPQSHGTLVFSASRFLLLLSRLIAILFAPPRPQRRTDEHTRVFFLACGVCDECIAIFLRACTTRPRHVGTRAVPSIPGEGGGRKERESPSPRLSRVGASTWRTRRYVSRLMRSITCKQFPLMRKDTILSVAFRERLNFYAHAKGKRTGVTGGGGQERGESA